MRTSAAILSVFFSLYAGITFSQVVADAGAEVFECEADTAILGGAPTAAGGTPPYTYTWEAEHVIGDGDFTVSLSASDFLSDTTSANPSVLSMQIEGTVEFKLTVTDSNGNSGMDTTRIHFAPWSTILAYMTYTINQGDSILLNVWDPISGGFPPYEYLWYPNHGLTDSTSLDFWAKPEESTAYSLTKTDSVGCQVSGGPFYIVNVQPLSADDLEISSPAVRAYPNPTKDFMTVQVNPAVRGVFAFRLFSANGKLLEQRNFSENTFEVNLSNHPPGVYVYEVTNNDGWSEQGRVVVQ